MLTKQLSTEWARYGVNIDAIAPTFVRTEQVANYLTHRELHEILVDRISM